MDLIINKIYLVHTGHFAKWDKEYYDELKPLVHTHTTNRMDEGMTYYFHDPLTDYRDSIPRWSQSNCIFENESRFFQYTIKEADRIGQTIGPILQDLIDKSMDESPEQWL